MSFQTVLITPKTCEKCGMIYNTICSQCQQECLDSMRPPQQMTPDERREEILSYQNLPEIPGFNEIRRRAKELVGRGSEPGLLHIPAHNDPRGWQRLAQEAYRAFPEA